MGGGRGSTKSPLKGVGEFYLGFGIVIAPLHYSHRASLPRVPSGATMVPQETHRLLPDLRPPAHTEPAMKIETGLFDHMVLQRNSDDVSEQRIVGHTDTDGTVLARVVSQGKTLRGWAKAEVGKSTRGKMAVSLAGLPVGGPYDITLSVGSGTSAEHLTVADVLVGDVWIMAGQSNMQGIGWNEYKLPTVDAVRNFYMQDEWGAAEDSLHNLWDAVDIVHAALRGGEKHPKPIHWSIGPGLAFGQTLHAQTGVPQGLIACAHGGTSMSQWDPELKDQAGASLYGAMCRRLAKNGGRVAGMIWYQGESDCSPEASPHYTNRMIAFVKAVRRDTRSPRLPIATVQIGRVIGMSTWFSAWNDIQEQQRLLPERIPHLATVPSVDLPLDDGIHIAGDGQNVLGRRLAEAMQALRGAPDALPLPIELHSIDRRIDQVSNTLEIRVRYTHVVGALSAPGMLPLGFTFRSTEGIDQIVRTTLRGDTVLLRVGNCNDNNTRRLAYGHGFNPACNIHDEAGRPLPVFSARQLLDEQFVTPFVRKLGVSPVVPLPRPLAALTAADLAALPRGEAREFAGDFCDLHDEISRTVGQDNLVLYTARFECPKAMKLNALLGYDGPVRVWINGKAIYHDANGRNPAIIDAAILPFTARPGTNEVVIALSTNKGRAWGIYLRFQRTDLARKPTPAAQKEWQASTVKMTT